MTPENENLIAEVRRLSNLDSPDVRRFGLLKLAPALADALESAERDKAVLAKGMLERWKCTHCDGTGTREIGGGYTGFSRRSEKCDECIGTGTHPGCLSVLRSIGIEDIEAARELVEKAGL